MARPADAPPAASVSRETTTGQRRLGRGTSLVRVGLWALAVWPTVAAGKAWFLAEMVRLYDHAAPANPKYQEWLY